MSYLAHADTGDAVPPLTLERVFTTWVFEPLPLACIVVALGLYAAGVRVLARRGDHWSWGRTLSFCVGGLGVLGIATSTSLAAYDTVLLSMHMVQHMLMSMVAPVFLALGAPVTLALRTLPRRPRGWLLAALHSRLAAVLAFPPVAFALFVLTPWVLYFSGWYDATLESAALHDLMHLHFVAVGCLFFWPLLGVDPVPGRVAYPLRMLTVFATLPFHAFLGVTIMTMDTLIAGDWYTSFERDWPPSVADDQYLAGGILWASGDLIALVFFGVLFAQWVRQSQREAAREDRRLDAEEAAAAAAGSIAHSSQPPSRGRSRP